MVLVLGYSGVALLFKVQGFVLGLVSLVNVCMYVRSYCCSKCVRGSISLLACTYVRIVSKCVRSSIVVSVYVRSYCCSKCVGVVSR